MTITRPAYSNRDETARSIDFKPGVDANAALDRALVSTAENIDAHTHRVFYPWDTTLWWDWPSQGGSGGGQRAMPWRLWFDEWDCCYLETFATGGVTIPTSAIFLEPVNRKPGWPFTELQLDRSQSYGFGGNSQTPQHALMGTGTWGFSADAYQVAALAAEVGLDDTDITISDGSQAGVGDLLVLGYGRGEAAYPSALGYAGAVQPYQGERCLVTSKATAATGLTQSGSGCSLAAANDQALSTTGTGALNVGEVLLLDQEQMLVTDVTAGVATVERAWAGTTLATHSAATVYAYRLLGVDRAQLGTTASTYAQNAVVCKHRKPGLVRDLSIAESVNRILQEGSGYARTVGSGENVMPASGAALADLWAEVKTAFGRKARKRAV